MTLLWHMGLKVPWAWQCGPSNASERSHFRELLETQSFPENTLFCGDAGFVGFSVWKAILDNKHNFLMRVGGNLQLLNDLGRLRQGNGLVHFWPRRACRQGLGPLTLRLIEFQTSRGPIYLVTNVLSDRVLTVAQAKRLYRLRWGVEVQFRSLKQTFGRSKLRSRTPQRALLELEWSLVGLWLVQLFAVKEQIAIDAPPERSSVSLALGVIRHAMRCWSAPATSPHILRDGFRMATLDPYRRHSPKQGRYRPSAQDIPWTTKPIIRPATKKQKQTYLRLLNIAA